jgi:hypothetical protein
MPTTTLLDRRSNEQRHADSAKHVALAILDLRRALADQTTAFGELEWARSIREALEGCEFIHSRLKTYAKLGDTR